MSMQKPIVLERDVIVQSVGRVPGVTLREQYSGKSMYGATCVGFSGHESDLAQVMIEIAIVDPVLARALAKVMASDAIGLRRVHYFPGFTIEEES